MLGRLLQGLRPKGQANRIRNASARSDPPNAAIRDDGLTALLQHLPQNLQTEDRSRDVVNIDVDHPPAEFQEQPLGQDLRAVGRMTQALGLRDFRIVAEGKDYVIHGIAAGSPTDHLADPRASSPSVEIRCTPEMISRIDLAGRDNRGEASAALYATSPSQILRVVGNSVAAQRAKLVGIERTGDTMVVETVSDSSGRVSQERTVESFLSLSGRLQTNRSR